MNPVSTKYTLHIDLPVEYSSFQSLTGKKNMLPEEMQQIYNQAPKSLDIWCNGSIYPLDPLTNSSPPFFKPTGFLKYVGDGYNGLLGYCIRLLQYNNNSTMLAHQTQSMQCVINDQNILIESLKSSNSSLSRCLQDSQKEVDDLKCSLEAVRIESDNLKKQLHSLKQTPLGLRTRKRCMKPIESLSISGGARKKRIHAIRYA